MWKKSKRYVQSMRDRVRRQMGLLLFDRHSANNAPISLMTCQRVLLIRWDAKYGDSIVSSFLFREMKRVNPDISIEVLCVESMLALFKNHWHADQVYLCAKRPSYCELWKIANEMGDIDLVIHFTKVMKMKDLFFLHTLRPRYIASLDDEPNCVNIKLREKTKGFHFADKFSYLLRCLGAKSVDTSYVIPKSIENEDKVSLFWPKGIEKVIAINPFGAGSSRKLTVNSICKIVNIVNNVSPSFGICLLCQPKEFDIVSNIVDSINDPSVFLYPDGREIYDLFAQLRLCAGLISVDTATIHIASGLKIPVLGLYNPDMDNYNDWGPNNEQAITIFASGISCDVNDIDWHSFEDAVLAFIDAINKRC